MKHLPRRHAFRGILHCALTLGGAAAAALPAAALAQAAATLDVPAGPLDAALNRYAAQAGLVLVYDPALMRGLRSPGLHGSYPPDAALAALLRDTGLMARRGDAGRYAIVREPAGAAQLEAVTVDGYSLGESSEALGGYAIPASATATKLDLSLRETPQTVSVMTRQRIEDQNLNSVSDVLQQAPGISVQNMGSERFNVYSRGYAIDQYQLDGVPTVVEVGTQDVAPSLADTVVYDRVEVLRGAAGLMSGVGEPAGTLNFVRKRPTTQFQGHVSAGAGSWDRFRLEADVAGPLNPSGSVRGRAIAAQQRGGSFIDYYREKKDVLYGVIEADLTATTQLTAGIDYQRKQPTGTLGGLGTPLFYSTGEQADLRRSRSVAARNNFFDVEAVTVFGSLRQELGGGWTGKLSFNRLESQRDFQTAMASLTAGFANPVTGAGVPLWIQGGNSRQVQTGLDLHLEGPYTLFGREHQLVAGVSFTESDTKSDVMRDVSGAAAANPFNLYGWRNQSVHPDLVKNYDNDTYTRESGAYLATRLRPTDRLSLIAGARVSNYKWHYQQLFAAPASRPFDQDMLAEENGRVSPYAGVLYDLDDSSTIYASYASIYKPQYYRDRNGRMLDPRQGENIELGWKGEFANGRLEASAAVYEIRQDNLAIADDGQIVPGTDNVAAYRAVPGARTRGLDLELTGELSPGWQVSASYAYNRSEDADGKRIKTVMPEHLVKVWTTYRLPGDWNRTVVGAGVNWQSRIHYSATPWQLGRTVTASQPAYAVVNLMASHEFSPSLTATLNLNNVFDKKYLDSLDTTFNTGYYGAPRNAMLNLKYRF